LAASKGKTVFVRELLNYGADANLEDNVIDFFCNYAKLVNYIMDQSCRIIGRRCCALPKKATPPYVPNCSVMEPMSITKTWLVALSI